MGTRLKRNDFKKQYPLISQGLFIFEKEKHIPDAIQSINLGIILSEQLLKLQPQDRKIQVQDILDKILSSYQEAKLEHVEILFTPSLELDPVGTLLSICRNKKICFVWPGIINQNRLQYENLGSPEYYETEINKYIDTYIITGGM